MVEENSRLKKVLDDIRWAKVKLSQARNRASEGVTLLEKLDKYISEELKKGKKNGE